jgi:hypothetical protein
MEFSHTAKYYLENMDKSLHEYVQHTYKFYKAGYVHMSTVSGPPTYWQSTWGLTPD